MTRPTSPQDARSAPTYPAIATVVDLLRDDRPTPIGNLAEHMDVPRRVVEKCIEELKRDGYPVICDGRGCWRATTADELRDAYRRERSRAIRQMVNTRGRLKAIAAMRGEPKQEALPWAA